MKALVIAGGLPQIELIRQLKERGITTVLADGSPMAIAAPYADEFHVIPIFDIEAVKDLAVKAQVDFLITVCADQVLLVVAQVAEMLGLPCYIDYETARNVSDKLLMKHIFAENGIPSSRYVQTTGLDDPAIDTLRYPLVVKPVDAYSSRGVRKAKDREELEGFYEEAARISRSGGVIVEEFFEGEEISVDAFVVDGKARILTVSNSEKILDDGRFVIFRGRYPASAGVNEKVLAKIEETCQKIADAFHLVNAPLLVQLLSNGEQISVLEICARTGGNMKYLLIKYSCGVDVISATIDLFLGKVPDVEVRDTGNAIVVNDFIYCRPGIFDHLEGFDEMQSRGLINEYHAVRAPGFEARGVTSSSDRVAGMNIVAQTAEEFNRKLCTINGSVKVIDAEGRDIMRHDLLPALK